MTAAEVLRALGIAPQTVWMIWLVFLRAGAAVALMPAFGETMLPMRIRLAAALAFTAVVAPSADGRAWPDPGLLPVLGEVAAGLLIGLSLRLLVIALQIAGTMAAQAMSLTQIFGSPGGEPQPAAATFLVLAGLALAVTGGLHVAAAKLLILSYGIIPPGAVPAAADARDWGIAAVAEAFALAFSLAAPFAIASLLWNVALGLINRAMPAMMVTFIGAPALGLASLLALAALAPALLSIWQQALFLRLGDPLGLP